ncbi:MAG: MoxR family ATPase [Chloroflexi bacterium]|nr:MoxR family ATPase [Chloroflexota bacterium]
MPAYLHPVPRHAVAPWTSRPLACVEVPGQPVPEPVEGVEGRVTRISVSIHPEGARVSQSNTVKSVFEALRAEAGKVLVGQDVVFEQITIALLARGHVLLEGVPGVAKTLAAKTMAQLIRADFRRVQFTPDLMPSDIVGTQVYDVNSGKFYLKKGPIFTNILLADEINRAPAKTQSALLEAMEERQVTIEGERYELPEPFMVLATQNPVEYEGTYPLPEAQLDRFLFKILVTYLPPEAEAEVLRRYHHGFDAHHLSLAGLTAIIGPAELLALRAQIQAVTVEDGIMRYITSISDATRKAGDLALGGSPRASIAMLLAAKAWAALQGRDYVVPDDVKALVLPIFRHRIILKPEAEIEGLNADGVMRRITGKIEVPR